MHDGNWSYELNGDSTIHHSGDHLVDRHGNFHDQTDSDWTQIVNGTLKSDVGGSMAVSVAKNYSLAVGEDFVQKVLGNGNSSTQGSFVFDVGDRLDLSVDENIEVHSKKGNIAIQTDGEFELMDGKILTSEGYRNLGTKGNITIKSTFGNIGMTCVENSALADFGQETVVAAWNPSFLTKLSSDCTEQKTLGELLELDSVDTAGFASLMADLSEAQIFDGLPVFLPTKMIVQNPNIRGPENDSDLNWMHDFRKENSDWRNISTDAMWKIPSKLMGNINIETWSGDITVKTNSYLGCAGNIEISATEQGGTLPGYKVGTVEIKNSAERRVYPDPRDLFLDSDFLDRTKIFVHGTDKKVSPVLGQTATDGILQGTILRPLYFQNTSYKGFNDLHSLELSTWGHMSEMDAGHMETLMNITDNLDDPELGCPHCITDYLLSLPGVTETLWTILNIKDLPVSPHEFGSLKFDPEKHNNRRGPLNLLTGEYDRLSLGDGHAIETGFTTRALGGASIGAFTVTTSGDRKISAGGNYKISVATRWAKAITSDEVIHEETPQDDYVPEIISTPITTLMETFYDANVKGYITCKGDSIQMAKNVRGHEPRTFNTSFTQLKMMPSIGYRDGGSITIRNKKFGSAFENSIQDNRKAIDYGFDFHKMMLVATSLDVSTLETNFYDNNITRINSSDSLTTSYLSGGNYSTFKFKHFSFDTHIEGESHLDNYYKATTYGKSKYTDTVSYHDDGIFWWDLDGFSADQFAWFPDIEVENKFQKFDTLKLENSEVNHNWEHSSLMKFGNHEAGKSPFHKNYSKVNCPYATYAVDNDKIELKGDVQTNPAKLESKKRLWTHKKCVSVVDKESDYRKTDTHNTNFEILKPCKKNRWIVNDSQWFSNTQISGIVNKESDCNIVIHETNKSLTNEKTEKVSGAVNNRYLELNSNTVALEKLSDKEKKERYDNEYDYRIMAGNSVRTILKGNQKFHNYVDDDISHKKITQGDYSNVIEFAQNGFNQNRISFKNGTNSKWGNDRERDDNTQVDNPHNEDLIRNEFSVFNGGTTESSIIEPNDGTKRYKYAYNYLNLQNGSYEDKTKTNVTNTVSVENGFNVMTGANLIYAENGDMLKKGGSTIRLSNWRKKIYDEDDDPDDEKQGNTENVSSVINIDNARQTQGLAMSDSLTDDNIISSNVSLYSKKDIELNSNRRIYMNSPHLSANFQTGDIWVDGGGSTENGLNIRSNAMQIDVANLMKIAAKDYSLTSTTGEWLGKTIDIFAYPVTISKAVTSGEYAGSYNGFFTGNLYGCLIDPVKSKNFSIDLSADKMDIFEQATKRANNEYVYNGRVYTKKELKNLQIDYSIFEPFTSEGTKELTYKDWRKRSNFNNLGARRLFQIINNNSIARNALATDKSVEATPEIAIFNTPVNNEKNERTLEEKSFNVFKQIKNVMNWFIEKELNLLGKKTQKNN